MGHQHPQQTLNKMSQPFDLTGTKRSSYFQQHQPIKLITTTDEMPAQHTTTEYSIHHHQTTNQQQTYLNSIVKKLLTFFYFYAILIISVYLTYAACYYYYNNQHHLQQQQQLQLERPTQGFLIDGDERQQSESGRQFEAKFESKIQLLERYIDSLALDLQETKVRLREREKCDCSISCTFNGTRYADKSSWQNQCDVCTCRAGSISCSPQKCPILNCDSPLQLPGQCCPTCMKNCKHNNTTIKHGQKFNPHVDLNNNTTTTSTKECKCLDGLIKCEQTQVLKQTNNRMQQQQYLTPQKRKIVRKPQISNNQTLNALMKNKAI